MKKIIPFLLIASFIITSCSKGKFDTKPRVEIKSVSSSTVPINSGLNITLDFFDKEGDVDSVITIVRQRLNRRAVPPGDLLRSSFSLQIPEFPNKSQGEISLDFTYETLKNISRPPTIPGSVPTQYEPDSLLYKFVLKDKGKNVSDTVTTTIIVLRTL